MIAPADVRLVQQTLQGERAAFDELVRRHQQCLYRLALRVLRNEEDARDALQDSLWLGFSRLQTLQQQTMFFQWLCQITQRTAITRLRQRKPWVSLDALFADQGFEPLDSLPGPDDALHQDECRHHLEAALEHLSPAHRDVVRLDLDGTSYPGIATRLQIPLGTVRSRLHRARVQLRELLAGHLPDAPPERSPTASVAPPRSEPLPLAKAPAQSSISSMELSSCLQPAVKDLRLFLSGDGP